MTDENRSLKDKIRDFLEEKGVYVVLLASVAIVGIAAAAAYWPKQQPQPSAEPSPAPVSQNEDQTLSEALLSTPVPTPTASPSALQSWWARWSSSAARCAWSSASAAAT